MEMLLVIELSIFLSSGGEPSVCNVVFACHLTITVVEVPPPGGIYVHVYLSHMPYYGSEVALW